LQREGGDDRGAKALGHKPKAKAGRDQRQLQQGTGGRGGDAQQRGVCHPCGDLDGKGRGQAGAKDQRHVDIGHAIGQDRKAGQAQCPVKRGQGCQGKAHDAAIAKAGGCLGMAGRVKAGQGGQCHQQKEGHLFGDKAKGQGKAHRVVQDQKIGRVLPAGRPRRGRARDPARRCDQKGQPKGCGGMGQRQKRRKAAAECCKACGP
jgi:hypothetical protein